MRALIIIDMLNDFVDGQLANPKAQAIIEPLQRLLAHAREEGWSSSSRTTPISRAIRRCASGASTRWPGRPVRR